jgi:hypothetical protein
VRLALALASVLWAGQSLASEPVTLGPRPRIEPDYTDLVIPANIAPLNFAIREPGTAFHVRLSGVEGAPVEVHSRSPKVRFPADEWRRVLEANRGGPLRVEVGVQADERQERWFPPWTNWVAGEEVDPVLIYRKIHPSHNTWRTMGIYQRDLRTFDETPILENRRFDNDCCHCHALRNNDPNHAIVLIRSTTYQPSILVISNGAAETIAGRAGITVWHPRTDLVVSAFSKAKFLVHSAKPGDMRDIAEEESWLGCFHLGTPTVREVPAGDRSRLLAFPAWSPDGSFLYYCSAPNPLANPSNTLSATYSTVHYDLMRIAYDSARDQWGQPETVLSASVIGRSLAQPHLSPDGHWLFFCGTAFGCWPTYDPGADLYGIDLGLGRQDGKYAWRKLELNSPECDSWLSWSSNSRWVVFSSKRASPLFNRPYLSYVAANGRCSKPFVAPQRDPEYYDSALITYTLPTLATGPITVPQRDLIQAIKATSKRPLVLPATRKPQSAPASEQQ